MALKRLTDEQRFFASIKPVAMGCWSWQKARDGDGYGLFKIGSRTDKSRRSVRAHRWAYEHFIGIIPAGLTLDHLCRNPMCARPHHLEPVTGVENTKRNWRAVATHCRRGHALSGYNLKFTKLGRACRECGNAAARKHGRKTKWAACRKWAAKQKERLQSA